MPRPGPIPCLPRNFGHYRVQAHCGAVAVSSHGRIAGYFIAPDDYERMRTQRRSFATAELDDPKVEAVSRSRMHRRHTHLNKLLKTT